MISLDKQVQIYSVDTSMFYTNEERRIHNKLNRYYRFRKNIIKLRDKSSLEDNIDKISNYIERSTQKINDYKKVLKALLPLNVTTRHLNDSELKKKNIISVFDSVLTRTLGVNPDEFSKEIIVVQSYFFDVLKDIILNGFIYKGEKYIVFTASAGQIRTKKTVFIKETTFLKHRDNLMCGLTIEKINNSEEKGMNINKFLAYLALCNSATEKWEGFNIDKTIVVDDLETDVLAIVDFIDNKTYEIERKTMPIPINHTDGCGMILPKLSKKSFMVRLPWVKGLLVPFPFDKFAKDNESIIIRDIYNKDHDIIKEKIEVILTKSQFKMWKYYESWGKYQDEFKKYGCEAAKCNEEEDYFSDAKLNYQMLQTLNEMTNEELKKISQNTIESISNIGRDKSAMLKVLGVTKSNTDKSYFQQALELYPELLQDPFSRESLKNVKKSLVSKAKSGKLNINGKYTFIIPDLHAFCERLFLNSEKPNGLLKNGEVHCSLYKDGEKLDCLRSPHLYREHAVRVNIQDEKKTKWFITKGLYASIHDPISKILQYDSDGDKSLVTPNITIVECAERHMEDIVPLYYEMAVSGKQEITNENLYNGLVTAYVGGNIGEISNNISKIWNSVSPDLDAVKWLCMENNFVIDYAKTLFKLKRPKENHKKIRDYTKNKLPSFFVHAKDKTIDQVEVINESVVNRLNKLIPSNRVFFKDLGLKKIDYQVLLSNKEYIEDQEIIAKYNTFVSKRRFMKITKYKLHVYQELRDDILSICDNKEYATDVLVNYLFIHKKSSKKETLWQSFGDVIVENIKRNLGKYSSCFTCGIEIEAKQARKYCDDCSISLRRKYKAEKEKEYRLKKRGQNK